MRKDWNNKKRKFGRRWEVKQKLIFTFSMLKYLQCRELLDNIFPCNH